MTTEATSGIEAQWSSCVPFAETCTSALGEAVLERALADPLWLDGRLADVKERVPLRAIDFGRVGIVRADQHLRWTQNSGRG